MPADSAEAAPAPGSVYDVAANDPSGRLVDRGAVSPADLTQISELMQAMGALRDVEDRLNEASQAYMKLGRTDMRALHFLIVSENRGQIVTGAAIAAHLHITSASTTKLLDRLERAGHITRSPHPSDRRASAIRITEQTRQVATDTVGVYQSRRFHAAARLTPQEREVVIRFLRDTARELSDGAAGVAAH
ncbi:DNA-binding transcriptional regulator, MarR family [Raineyella antarctica]|uniref:DNA-binding transcriptional regulator, MarR family n=1 Tax=Raineyella antarctica TaxID=1577474 RepID=A0A1G6H765_9ACTN|nr:MarR family transcriptional regulator [Raineyella antarctica]SDB90117.1 DNA-binding transcriptional regulator, MarR family [Raineyella antarctica]